MKSEQKYQLEQMIDSTSLKDVLNAINDICQEKGEHIRTNWQDAKLAQRWERDGNFIANFVDKLHN